MRRSEHLRNLVALAALGLVIALLPPALTVYLRSFAMFTMMYVVLALSWNIISGFTGYTSFGHVIFYGIGSYTCAILMADYGWHWLTTLMVAAGVAAAPRSISSPGARSDPSCSCCRSSAPT